MKRISSTLVASVILFAGGATTHGQSSAVPWSAFGSGYATQTDGSNTVRALIGQAISGRSSGSGNVLSAGFIPASLALGGGTTGVTLPDESLPREFALRQNYPNPFNPVTTVRYDLPIHTHVSLMIYDVLGREVKTLVDANQDPGRYSIVWDGTSSAGHGVSSGVYIYRLQSLPGNGGAAVVRTMKMMLLK